MPKLTIINQTGEKVGNIELSDYVFGIAPHQQAIFDVVNAQRAAMRQGTSAVKSRAEVRGGGKKPWRQKGTGRARQGSIRSPQWRGGGIVFGPTPRSYSVKINKKVRNLAFRSALSSHVLENKLTVLDKLISENGKTKEFQAILNSLNLEGKVLFISNEFDGKEVRAGRNIPRVQFADVKHVSVYDVLNTKNLVLTEGAAKALEEALGNE
ncbi:50S ribosomal protein L4 [Haploplasma axanthum]|uniref:Large ribosomal subunit protein uL4 n=1 Tax=Haploplasma axanthum TaxID=29552 RepID=A0A449BCB7_HAPAX|nr:50S ribosomal protein L4 [Haploplasma axanthum]VEU80091.1 50S ribosomal protein L4 [Haploplasma axanthum]